jgi:dephospho-CoA kinase
LTTPKPTNANSEKISEQKKARTLSPGAFADQFKHLIKAGQHHIIADGLYTWTEYKYLKREFPGELTVVAVVAPRHARHHRLNSRPVRPLTTKEASERDWAEIENLEKGGPIAVADYYVMNDRHLEHLHAQIDAALSDIGFYNQ